MSEDAIAAWLALSFCSRLRCRSALTILNQYPTLTKLTAADKNHLATLGLKTNLVLNESLLEATLRWAENDNHHILTYHDPNYPARLKEIAHPPLLLYAKGNIKTLSSPQIGIIGSRNPTFAGVENAKNFAGEIARQGIIITSGLALGIDTTAHAACLEQQQATHAVLGTGLDSVYPHRNTRLAAAISETGVLLTEFALGTPPKRQNFPQRNRIISGLCLGIVVVEAAARSGSLITARMAMEQNREVFAIPGAINNPLAKGCHLLLRQGAKLVENTEDILEELKLLTKLPSMINNNSSQMLTLADTQQKLVKSIDYMTTPIEVISQRMSMGHETLLTELYELERQGLIKADAGGYTRNTQ